MARYLQVHLSKLPVQDPYMVQGTEEVIEFSKEGLPVTCMSVDVKDMFYSIPQAEALTAVEESIATYGDVRFQRECGTSINGFMNLLKVYPASLYVIFAGKVYGQRDGICIGSCLKPVLSNLLMAKGD